MDEFGPMKKLLLALALLLLPASASAQCSGVFGASKVCGSVAGGVPGQIDFSAVGSLCTTLGTFPVGTGSAVQCSNIAGSAPIANATGGPFDAAFDLFTDDGGTGTTSAAYSATTYAGTGAGNTGGLFHGRCVGGSRASPSICKAGWLITGIGGLVYTGAALSTSSPDAIHFIAAEDQSLTNNGSYINFYTTPIGTALASRINLLTLTNNTTIWGKDSTAGFDPLNTLQTKPSADILMLISGATSATYGSAAYGAAAPGFRFLHAGGTPASPTATPTGANLGFIATQGFTTNTTPAWATTSTGLLRFISAEAGDFTTTAQGTRFELYTTPVGSVTRAEILRGHPSGGVSVGNTTDPGIGSIGANVKFVAAGNNGLSVTKTVRAAGGAADCSLIFTGGILTGGSC